MYSLWFHYLLPPISSWVLVLELFFLCMNLQPTFWQHWVCKIIHSTMLNIFKKWSRSWGSYSDHGVHIQSMFKNGQNVGFTFTCIEFFHQAVDQIGQAKMILEMSGIAHTVGDTSWASWLHGIFLVKWYMLTSCILQLGPYS